MPEDRGRSTIEAANPLEGAGRVRDVPVEVRTLDSFAPQRVSLIKIDVEGHEEAVLRGAQETVRRDQPALLIEVEERHNPGGLERVRAMLKGYTLTTFCDGKLGAIGEVCACCGVRGCINHNELFLPAGHVLLRTLTEASRASSPELR